MGYYGRYDKINNLFLFQVMEDTNTQISWPSKLKIGAKSKKGRIQDQGLKLYFPLFEFSNDFVCQNVLCK